MNIVANIICKHESLNVIIVLKQSQYHIENMEDIKGNSTNSTLETPFIVAEGLLIARLCFYTCLIVAILAGNSLVLVAIRKFENLRNVTNAFVACLAVADLCNGFGLLYQFVTFVVDLPNQAMICLTVTFLQMFSVTSSLLFLLGKLLSLNFCV